MSVAVDGEPLSAEAVRMLEYLRARAVSLTGAGNSRAGSRRRPGVGERGRAGERIPIATPPAPR